MKYALIKDDGCLRAIVDDEIQPTTASPNAVALTAETEARLLAGETLVCHDGEFITRRAKLWSENPEVVKDSLRHERNRLLAESDCTQLNDYPLSDDKRKKWAAYRQALRDLTSNIDENGEVEFPVTPK